MYNEIVTPMMVLEPNLTQEQVEERIRFSQKLYLILLYGEHRDNEDQKIQRFEFARGRQTAYDTVKDILISSQDRDDEGNPYYGVDWDMMRSMIIVDSPNISISKGMQLYEFMRSSKDRGKVQDDDSSFDIDEWFYDLEAES